MNAPRLQTFLDGLPDLATRSQLGLRTADFTLERMQRLMAALGSPQQQYASIHVAGTNGKGSVCALCAAALQAEGYKVGRFTSPHIEGALRGICINGQQAEMDELQATFERLYPNLNPAENWTHFEIVTALMFLHFARVGVEVAVVEVGLGGRLDATNVLTPLVSVITPIDYDHVAILGSTLAQIAGEKAGIIKPGVPVVIAPQAAEAREVILRRAEEQGTPRVEIGKDVMVERAAFDLSGQDLRVWRPGSPAHTLRLGLHGAYQATNAATAYAVLQVAGEHGVEISLEAIRGGFEAVRWPGRFELLQTDPPLILDAAHTSAAAAELRRALDDYFPDQRIGLVLGVSADKDLPALLAALLPRISWVIATQSPHPRAMAAAQLAEQLAALGLEAGAEADPLAALRQARQWAGQGPVLVAGSVFLVEALRNKMSNEG
jgi:dihydrofolate synthase/folylpolyglutamate synthase